MIKNNRILIVDDTEAIHHDIRTVLNNSKKYQDSEALELENDLFGTSDSEEITKKAEFMEYIIDDAYQGEKAIEMVEAAQRENYPFSLIFMDVRMPPGIDGIETIQKIWANYPNIEMVICTAYSDYSWNKIIDSLGRTDRLLFMRKPFDATVLKQITLTLTTKWQLQQKSIHYVEDLEREVAERTKQLNDLVKELRESKEKEELSTAALLRSDNELEQLLKSITAILIGVSSNDLVTHWNKAAEKAFGSERAQVMGKPFRQCGIKWDWDEFMARIKECRNKDEQSHLHDIRYTRSDGKEAFLQIIINPMAVDKTEHTGYLLLASDTTEQKALESQLAQAQKLAAQEEKKRQLVRLMRPLRIS